MVARGRKREGGGHGGGDERSGEEIVGLAGGVLHTVIVGELS